MWIRLAGGGRLELDAKNGFGQRFLNLFDLGVMSTREWEACKGAIPPELHFAVKKSGDTSLVEG